VELIRADGSLRLQAHLKKGDLIKAYIDIRSPEAKGYSRPKYQPVPPGYRDYTGRLFWEDLEKLKLEAWRNPKTQLCPCEVACMIKKIEGSKVVATYGKPL